MPFDTFLWLIPKLSTTWRDWHWRTLNVTRLSRLFITHSLVQSVISLVESLSWYWWNIFSNVNNSVLIYKLCFDCDVVQCISDVGFCLSDARPVVLTQPRFTFLIKHMQIFKMAAFLAGRMKGATVCPHQCDSRMTWQVSIIASIADTRYRWHISVTGKD